MFFCSNLSVNLNCMSDPQHHLRGFVKISLICIYWERFWVIFPDPISSAVPVWEVQTVTANVNAELEWMNNTFTCKLTTLVSHTHILHTIPWGSFYVCDCTSKDDCKPNSQHSNMFGLVLWIDIMKLFEWILVYRIEQVFHIEYIMIMCVNYINCTCIMVNRSSIELSLYLKNSAYTLSQQQSLHNVILNYIAELFIHIGCVTLYWSCFEWPEALNFSTILSLYLPDQRLDYA